jgi:hypothetical protein
MDQNKANIRSPPRESIKKVSYIIQRSPNTTLHHYNQKLHTPLILYVISGIVRTNEKASHNRATGMRMFLHSSREELRSQRLPGRLIEGKGEN